jgi:hypothetical protein
MLEVFVGPRPEGMEGCHKDDNQFNNSLDNIYWGTHKENCKDRTQNGKLISKRGDENNRSRITNKQVLEIRKRGSTKKRGIQTKLAII